MYFYIFLDDTTIVSLAQRRKNGFYRRFGSVEYGVRRNVCHYFLNSMDQRYTT
jgi:hypothetical protein